MNARQCLYLCRDAYDNEADFRASLRDYTQCEFVRYLDCHTTDTQGYIVQTRQDGTIVVTFRGTEITSYRDFITNLKLHLELDVPSQGYLHRGWKNAASRVFGDVVQVLEAHPQSPVIVAGHSLGGALATIVAFWIEKKFPGRVQQVQTFGSPRVGNSQFAYEYDLALKPVTFRHLNCCDIIARVPTYFQGYRHVGQLCYYDFLGRPLPSRSLFWRLKDQSIKRSMSFVSGGWEANGLADHQLMSYLGVVR